MRGDLLGHILTLLSGNLARNLFALLTIANCKLQPQLYFLFICHNYHDCHDNCHHNDDHHDDRDDDDDDEDQVMAL